MRVRVGKCAHPAGFVAQPTRVAARVFARVGSSCDQGQRGGGLVVLSCSEQKSKSRLSSTFGGSKQTSGPSGPCGAGSGSALFLPPRERRGRRNRGRRGRCAVTTQRPRGTSPRPRRRGTLAQRHEVYAGSEIPRSPEECSRMGDRRVLHQSYWCGLMRTRVRGCT